MFKEGAQLSILHGATSPCPPQLPPPLCLSLTLLTAAPPAAKPFLPRGHRLCHSSGLEHRAPDAGHCPPPFRHLSGITRARPHAPVRTVLPRAPLLRSLCFVLITCLSPWTPCVPTVSPREAPSEAGPQEASRMYARGPTEGTDRRSAGCLQAVDPCALGWRPLQGRRMSDSFSSPKHHFSLV